GLSLSFYLTGQVEQLADWHVAFMAAAFGPLLAGTLALSVPEHKAASVPSPATHLLDFRPVLRHRPAMGYVWAYTVHNFELFAFRSWIVVFLTFAQSLQPGGGPGLSATT